MRNETAERPSSQLGFRLQRLEVFNWGTFGQRVWSLEPGGHNALLTGDIGSGKSTAVDAITTLLVPHHRIVFNKAAGAEGKERSLYSYVRGEYKSAKGDAAAESGHGAKAVYLRDERSYSVLLAEFGTGREIVTIAQVFWLKDNQRNPERFFVLGKRMLTIIEDFSGFGSNPLDLKKQLKKTPAVEVFDQFKAYASRFKKAVGLPSERALDLFYQTISMKSVDNLTDFVRRHMLEPSDVGQRIEALRSHFDDLNRAHEAVLRAKDQVARLSPLVDEASRFDALDVELIAHRDAREGIAPFVAKLRAARLEERLERNARDLKRVDQKLVDSRVEDERLRATQRQIERELQECGGARLQELDLEITQRSRELEGQAKRAEVYHSLVADLGFAPVVTEQEFEESRERVSAELERVDRESQETERAQHEVAVEIAQIKSEHDEIATELDSLRSRKSNIPRRLLDLRSRLVEKLGLSEASLPFVGELVRVREDESEWEGAIERVLRSFALSVLVADEHYSALTEVVDATELRERLVYFRVRAGEEARGIFDVDPRALVRKVEIKHDCDEYPWLESHLANSFDYVCCDTLVDFRRAQRALTRQGQIKHGRGRHEKDDRHRIGDRSRYVLGWSNEQKIAALEHEQASIEACARKKTETHSRLTSELYRLKRRRDSLRDLERFESFAEIDVASTRMELERIEREKQDIESSSDVLETLRGQLREVGLHLETHRIAENGLREQLGALRHARESDERALAEAREESGGHIAPSVEEWLDRAWIGLFGDGSHPYPVLSRRGTELREHVQGLIDAAKKRQGTLTQTMVQRMSTYRTAYPEDTRELDASLDALPEYCGMHWRLVEEDLPRHEERFKRQLNEGTINSVALFQTHLTQEEAAIGEKLDALNASLQRIRYNPGTYITLLHEGTRDAEIRQFQADLRQCLEHGIAGGETYSEAKFLQIKKLIERFNGREGFSELDRRWTRKVTDVRNWFVFSASERWREDDAEREYYSDTSGKSGGQKEKLAYPVLASALAYQYGSGGSPNRAFRFVCIDEAFAKGSDESTRYALELFQELDLQLLIATPMQKVHVIEDYVGAVGFVHCVDGQASEIRNLTIDEFRAEREAHLMQKSAVQLVP